MQFLVVIMVLFYLFNYDILKGWEKAEAEALTLKTQLESVSLLKLTAENQVAHLDDALKECMKQIRNVKEESEQKLHDVVLANSRQLEQVELEFEIKINEFEEDLFRATAENDALSRSLEERSEMLMKISEEKAQADANIDDLKKDLDFTERELNSMKYEVNIVSKELEIRNEEKRMSERSVEVANKHHLEDVKKITKLEAECQKLRGLVRKKLPGPAALAQMKSEVDSVGRDYGESRVRRSPAKCSSPYMLSVPDYSFENIHQFQKENEFLNARLQETELDTKMLKEALSKRDNELQTSRNMFTKTANKFRSLESHMLTMNQKRSPSKTTIDIPVEGFLSQNESNAQSMTSMSEDGNDEVASFTEGRIWATTLMSNLKNDKDADKFSKAGSSCNLELMDDFLEMEKLACLSAESTGSVYASKDINSQKEEHSELQPTAYPLSFDEEQTRKIVSKQNTVLLSKFQSGISLIVESETKDNTNMSKLLESVKSLVRELEEELPHPNGDNKYIQKNCHEDLPINKCIEKETVMVDDLKKAIQHIYDFVELYVRSSDPDLLGKVSELSSVVNKVMSCDLCVDEFIVTLSAIFSERSKLDSRIFGNKECTSESSIPDYIDKVDRHEIGKGRLLGSFDAKTAEMKGSLINYSQEEFDLLKIEKDNLADELAKCTESLEKTKLRLVETEQNLQDLESQFTGSQKSNSLAETQLKCMAESYRLLESRSNDLETEISFLQSKIDTLEIELKNEVSAHQEDLEKYKDLQKQMERLASK